MKKFTIQYTRPSYVEFVVHAENEDNAVDKADEIIKRNPDQPATYHAMYYEVATVSQHPSEDKV